MKATVYRGYNLGDTVDPRGEEPVCQDTADHPGQDAGELACWRTSGHKGLHWDAPDKVAWACEPKERAA